MPVTGLDTADVVELAELLQFLRDWLESDRDGLAASLIRFTGSRAYGSMALHDDLARFRFLLGQSDGEVVSDLDER